MSDIKIQLGADTSEADSALRKLKGSFNELGEGAKKNQRAFKDLGDILRFTPVAAAIGTVIKVFSSAYQEAKKLGDAGTSAQKAFVAVGDSIADFKTEYLRTAANWAGELATNLGLVNSESVTARQNQDEEIRRLETRNKLLKEGAESAKKQAEEFSKDIDKINSNTGMFSVDSADIQDKIKQIDFNIKDALKKEGLSTESIDKLDLSKINIDDLKKLVSEQTGKSVVSPNYIAALFGTRAKQESNLQNLSTSYIKKEGGAQQKDKKEKEYEKEFLGMTLEEMKAMSDSILKEYNDVKDSEHNERQRISDENAKKYEEEAKRLAIEQNSKEIKRIEEAQSEIDAARKRASNISTFGMSPKQKAKVLAEVYAPINKAQADLDVDKTRLINTLTKDTNVLMDEYYKNNLKISEPSEKQAKLMERRVYLTEAMKKKQEEADKKAADESDKATRDADEKAKREANAAKELEEIKFSQLDLQEQYNALMEEANSMVVKTKEDELKYQKLLIQAKEVEAKIEDKKKKDAQEAKEAKEEEQKKFKESLSSEGFEIGDDGKLRRKGKKAIVSAADYARTKAAREKAIADAARTGQPIDDKKALTLAEKQANAIEEIRQALSIQQKL